MITTIIVVGAVALGAAFSVAWLCKPALRRQIEEPGYRFAAQARQYDQACHDAHQTHSATNEP